MCSAAVLPSFSQAASITFMPPFSRIALVEKLVCMPAPFQSPLAGFGSMVALMPKSSPMR
ncbi:hypothetical protein D3C83_202660 [compost metagenome]